MSHMIYNEMLFLYLGEHMSLRRKRKRKLRKIYRVEMNKFIEAIEDNTMYDIPYILSKYRRLCKFKKLRITHNTDMKCIRHAEQYKVNGYYYVNT